MLHGVAVGDDAAGTKLYHHFAQIRNFFATRLPPEESEDRFHDVMLAVLRAIRLGGIREPESLRAYAWATAHRVLKIRLIRVIEERKSSSDQECESVQDLSPNPELVAIRRQNKEVAIRVLAALPGQHREVLMRYYLHGQPRELIQAEMGLTATQFRLIKSRAKAAFTDRLRRRLEGSKT